MGNFGGGVARGVEADATARDETEALHAAVLLGAFQKELHAQADAQDGDAFVRGAAEEDVEAAGAKADHAARRGADAGEDDTAAAPLVRARNQGGCLAEALEG